MASVRALHERRDSLEVSGRLENRFVFQKTSVEVLHQAPPLSSAAYLQFEQQADANDPPQMPGAERDIRDATIEVKRRT